MKEKSMAYTSATEVLKLERAIRTLADIVSKPKSQFTSEEMEFYNEVNRQSWLTIHKAHRGGKAPGKGATR